MENHQIYSKKDKRITAILIAGIAAFTFGLFAPLNIYMSNIREFWFSPGLMMPLIIGVTAVLLAVMTAVMVGLSLAKDEIFIKISLIVTFLMCALFVQGNFVPDNNGVLDGSEIDWSAVNSDMIISILLWIAVVALCVYVAVGKKWDKMYGSLKPVLYILVAIEVVTLVTLFIMKHDFRDKNFYEVSTDYEYDVSSKENMFIFLLDDFDAGYMNKYREYIGDNLEDFTFYPDTLTMYGHTDLSLPQIISGVNYYNDMPYDEYLSKAYEESSLLNYCVYNGWNIGIYTESKIPAGFMADNTVNCRQLETQISSKRRFLTYIYQLVAYNYAPYHMKKIFWFYPDIINETKEIKEADCKLFEWYESSFYQDMNISTSSEWPAAFRFYHLKGMHGPRNTDANLNEVTEVVSHSEAFEGNMKLIKEFCDQLKSNNIYDSAIIVILADHGETYDDEGEVKQNPLLMIKGKNERHEFRTSKTPVSYVDLQTIYQRLLEGSGADEATDILSVGDERTFYRYDFELEKADEDYFPPIRECVTTGEAKDMDSLEYTGTEYVH